MSLDNKEQLTSLIRERAESSGLYKRLDASRRLRFEEAVESYASTVLNGATTRSIKNEWKMAALDSGAEDLLEGMKGELENAFGVGPGAFNSAIRNTARDVLLVMASPRAHRTIKDLFTIRSRAKHTGSEDVAAGRQFRTGETQPPSTGARTLRRRK